MTIYLQVVYVANILVAGWISLTCLFFPKVAVSTVFGNAYAYSIGCLSEAVYF